MECKVKRIVDRVLLKLNESSEELEAAVVYGDMGMEVRRLVTDLVEEGVRKAFVEAKREEISEVKRYTGQYVYIGEGVGEQELPEDYCRLVELRMSNWDSCVYEYVAPRRRGESETDKDSDDGSAADSWKGDVIWLRHHPEEGRSDVMQKKPALKDEESLYEPGIQPGFGERGQVLRIYGVTSQSEVRVLAYLPEPEVEDDKIWMPRSLFDKSVDVLVEMTKDIIGINE